MDQQLPTATVAEFRTWQPCWDESKINDYMEAYVDEPWTALDVLALRDVPDEDKLWVVLRPKMVPDDVLKRFGFWCADQARLSAADALEAAGIPSQARLLRALPTIVDESTARAARDAARDAGDAARAARDAAWAAWAAGDAGDAAARDAARDAASTAGYAATSAATRAATRAAQVVKLRSLLREWSRS